MADTVKNTTQVKVIAGFVDDDERTLAFDTTRNDITKADITAIDGSNILGDKAGAAFKEWKSAQIVKTKTTKLDLTTS